MRLPPLLPPVAAALLAWVLTAGEAPAPEPFKAPVLPERFHFRGEELVSADLANPYRPLEKEDPKRYFQALKEGKDLYYRNCLFCHGDHLDGKGPAAPALSPPPADFHASPRPEPYLFWRVAKGEARSAMPAWEEELSQEDLWKVLLWVTGYARDDGRTSAQGDRGRRLYRYSCAQCHGYEGRGDGPAAERLDPRPRDFASGVYKLRSTPSGSLPTDEDLLRSIAEGVPGTSMPAWKDVYSPEELRDLAAYIKTFSPRFASEPAPEALKAGAPGPRAGAEARGRRAYRELRCDTCHGREGRGDGIAAADLKDSAGRPIRPANFRKPWTLRGGSRAEDLRRAFMTGLDGTPMESYASLLSGSEGEAKAWDLAFYLRSLAAGAPREDAEILSRRNAGSLPESPRDPAWAGAPAASFRLFGQLLARPRRYDASVDYLTVRSLHDDDEIALLLEWDDPFRDPDLSRESPPDALQVQSPWPAWEGGALPPFLEGGPGRPVRLWRWDAASGRAAALYKEGPGSAEAPLYEEPTAEALWEDGRWRLALRVPRPARADAVLPLAFSALDGAAGEEGLRRSVSQWRLLRLKDPAGAPRAAAALLAFLAAAALQGGFARRGGRRG